MTVSNLRSPQPVDWLGVVRALGPGFAERAAAHDADGAFVAENFAELKQWQAFSAGVPEDLGGGGAGHRELCEMVRELAHSCPSTALAFSMHTHVVAATVWKWRHGQPAEALLRRIADEQLVLVSTGGTDWIDSNGEMRRVDGGYRVTARKVFASGSPAGDVLVTSSRYDDPVAGPQVLHFPVPFTSDGVEILDDWNTLGMRGTGSHTVLFDDVFVPEEAIALRRPRGEWHGSWSVVLTVALPIIMSCYRGIAEAAAERARQLGGKRVTGAPYLPSLVGEMENQLAVTTLAVESLVDLAADYEFEPSLERANAALVRKTVAAEAAIRTVEKAAEVSGGAGFFRGAGIEQLFRDVQAASFHPLAKPKQLEFSGRQALGLEPLGSACRPAPPRSVRAPSPSRGAR